MTQPSITKLLFGSLLLVSALALAMAVPAPEGTAYLERPRRVRVAEVLPVSSQKTVRFSGVTRSAERAELGFSIGARLLGRPVMAGQAIAAGAVLARLDAREAVNALAGATAGLADVDARSKRVASERERVQRLFDAAAATQEELEQAISAADALAAAGDAAAARVRDAGRLVKEALLTAPFDGIVTEVHFEPGEFVPAGRSVVVMSGSAALETEIGLPESIVLLVSPGDRVRVTLPMADLTTTGTVTRVGRAAGSVGGLYPALIALEAADDLLAGMSAEVEFELAARDALSVPLAAVLNPGGGRPRVFRLAGDRVEPVEIEVLELAGGRVAVAAELAAGDEVVVTGHAALVPGDRVEVLR